MVDIKAFMANKAACEGVDQLEAIIDKDEETCALLDAAQSAKDVFEAVKKYVTMKFEDFTALFDDVMDYFKEDKAVLADETLECVVGGWSLSGLWQSVKKKATAIIIGAACGAAVGAAVGALAGAGAGALIGAFTGAVVGGIAGALLSD